MDSVNLAYFLGETLGMAVVDSGCAKTVCGHLWFKAYYDTLSVHDRKLIENHDSDNRFRFGDGETYCSMKSVTLPFYIEGERHFLNSDIVNCDVPLLLSRESLERAGAVINFQRGELLFLGKIIPAVITKSGHYCLPLTRDLSLSNKHTSNVLFNFKFDENLSSDDLTKQVNKLHRQFAHPTADRLIKLLKTAHIDNKNVFDTIHNVSDSCDVCKRLKKSPLRPAVGFPLATEFNSCIAVDLKSIGDNLYILHIIDHLTRYSQGCLIRNKRKGVIVKGLLEVWVRIFGAPSRILSDNGGEFVNNEIVDFAEKFNVSLETTAAESAWSNGLVEKHNGVLNNMLQKVMKDANCSADIALNWALAAKNCLLNVFGFCPNILVFGINPGFPSVLSNRPPANNAVTVSKYLSDNLNALHCAREEFMKQEASEKLKRALSRKTRTYSDNVFCIGDTVYYFRDSSSYWHGPAKIIGRDGKQCLLKHGGLYIRVHPCKLQFASENQVPDDSVVESTSLLPSPAKLNKNVSDPVFDSDSDTSAIASNEEPITENLNPDEITVASTRDLPKNGTCISFKDSSGSDWRNCEVISRGGKAKGANWHYLNIKEGTDEKCISFKDITWKGTESTEEVLVVDSDPTDKEKFENAKLQELEKWKEMNVYKEVSNHGQSTLSTRWVLTKKVSSGTICYKARLVARGFEEDTPPRTDSPTCCKNFLRLVFAIFAANNWLVYSLDVKSAFLQGLPIDREIFIKPPSQAKTNKLWQLLQCPYGLADASRQWYLKVKQELLQLGFVQLKLDNAVFSWYHNGCLHGLVACHVDDFVYAGSDVFHNVVVNRLRSVFIVGKEQSHCFKFLGIFIECLNDGIRLSMQSYTNCLLEINMSNLSKEKSTILTVAERNVLKQLSGQINWVTTQCRPDVSYENCIIANSLSTATVRDIVFANKVIRKLKNCSSDLFFYSDMNLNKCAIVSFCDASFGNLPNGGSQGAYITFLIDSTGLYVPIAWQSRRVRRVVKSTVAAECLAAIEAAENVVLIHNALKSILNNPDCFIECLIYCDNKNLVNAVHSSTKVEDQRLQIDVCVLRDMLSNGELSKFCWVPTSLQIANCLTKQGASVYDMLNVLNKKLRFNFSDGTFT